MSITPVAAAPETLTLPPAHPVAPVAEVARVQPSTWASHANLSQAAQPVFEALQSAAAFPPSATPSYVLPPNSNILRLFSAVQAIAAERVYPAPVFSFTA
jgi:hypothetical protein